MRKSSARTEGSQQPGWQQKLLVFLVLASFGITWACSHPPEPKSSPMASVDPVQALRQMSEKLAKARQLTFKAKRHLDAALVEGSPIPESAEIDVAVSRPNKVMAKTTSNGNVRHFYADGQNLSLLDETMKVYSTVALPGTIDEVVGKLDEKYGFTPPLAEFVLNDPYQRISGQVQHSTYRGNETVNGVECQHLGLTGEVADAELWVSTGDQLPRRLVATFKDREGNPQLKIDFSDWNLEAKLEDSLFTFEPPKDAEKIKMVGMEEVKESEKKSSKGTK